MICVQNIKQVCCTNTPSIGSSRSRVLDGLRRTCQRKMSTQDKGMHVRPDPRYERLASNGSTGRLEYCESVLLIYLRTYNNLSSCMTIITGLRSCWLNQNSTMSIQRQKIANSVVYLPSTDHPVWPRSIVRGHSASDRQLMNDLALSLGLDVRISSEGLIWNLVGNLVDD